MSVLADTMSLILPPQRAIWLPAGTRHELHCRSPVSLRTIYVTPEVDTLFDTCCVLEITEFMRALILEVVDFGQAERTAREKAILQFMLTEIRRMEQAPFRMPMPRSPRLHNVCMGMLRDPADKRDINHWAQVAGMSRRNFTRAFRNETGMSVAVWRQQVRLMEAVSLLQNGQSVTSVAFDIGYESISSFTAMFQRAFGMAPTHFVDKRLSAAPASAT